MLGNIAMNKAQKTGSRRGVLAVMGLSGAAAAALSMLPRKAAETVEATTSLPKKMPAAGGGYALTEHVKRYYKTTLV